MSQDLKRTLSLPDAISIVAGSMIGCGIFIVSADISRQVNSGLLLIIVWIIAGFITLCGGLSLCELASNITDEGGQYVYLKKIFNEKIAFLYGWTLFLVIQTGTIAAVCVAFSKFFGILVPTISSENILFNLGLLKLSTQQVFAICTVIFLSFLNSRGIKYGVITQNIFTATKVLSLAAIVIIGLIFGFNSHTLVQNIQMPIALGFETINIIAVAIVGALFASITWNNITFIAGEVKNPKKNIPKAMISGVFLVVSLYLLMNFIYLGVLPLESIKTAPQDIVAARTIAEIFGTIGKDIIAIIIMISAFGCANGMILTGSRVYYKMAKDKAFFRPLALINRKTKVPVNSLWAQCLWICILILWGNYSELLDFVIYASLIFYILVTAGVFVYRKKFPNTNKKFRINNFFPITFLILASYIVICLSIYKPLYTIPGLLITIAGIPVFHIWNKTTEANNLNKTD
ncbi:MAG: amino acid permease [Clostridium sp.]|nr:amino acid permease [Clostridium sp.]